MKILFATIVSLTAFTATAQTKGSFESIPFEAFTLHVYNTNDAMGDASYIVEGKDALVTLEEPLFKDNVAEFKNYLKKLDIPVVERISDYHLGGTADEPVVMPEGMPQFAKGPIYSGMMENFAKGFGDAIVSLPTGKTREAKFGTTYTYAGVPFTFSRGANSDFPGASILIGKNVYFTHWTPMKSHVSPLHISSAAAIDAQIAETEKSLKSGATLFIGGHGGAAKMEVVKFKISYLKTLKKLLAKNKTAEDFVVALKKAYPNLAGEENLKALSEALYK